MVLCILIFVLGRRQDAKDYKQNGSKHFINLICSSSLLECNFDLSLSLPNISTLTHFHRLYSLLPVSKLCFCPSFLWRDLTIQLFLRLLVDQPPY
jgi:hypothetical protein